MTCLPWVVLLVAAVVAMLAMGPLSGAAASADGVDLILIINQLSIKVGATIQVRRTITPGTWSHPTYKEEMEADVVVALVGVWMMVPLNGEDPNPNIQAQPLQDLQVAPIGEICLIPTQAKFVEDHPVHPDPVLVVPPNQMDQSGLVVPQEEVVVVGVMTCPTVKWAMAAAAETLAAVVAAPDGVTLTPEKSPLSGPIAALVVGTGVPDTPWDLLMVVCIALVPDGVLTIPLTRLMDPQDGHQTILASKPLVDPKSPLALLLMICLI